MNSTIPQSNAARLERTSPQKAVELYIDARKNEVTEATTESLAAQMLILYSASILVIRTMHRVGWF